MKSKPRITYYYRGQVERIRMGGRGNWYDGYSANGPDGGVLYPWMTKPECQRDARTQGAVATFVDERARKEESP